MGRATSSGKTVLTTRAISAKETLKEEVFTHGLTNEFTMENGKATRCTGLALSLGRMARNT